MPKQHPETNESSLTEWVLGATRQVMNTKVSTYYSFLPPTDITTLILWAKTTSISIISTNWITKIIYLHTVAYLKTLAL